MSKVAISGGATGSATYTIQAPTGSTDRVLTLPDEAGTVLTSASSVTPSAGPSFRVYATSGTSLGSATATKVLFAGEEWDTDSCYDTTTSRFTPNVAGYYQINASVNFDNSTNQPYGLLYIYKNGSQIRQGSSYSSGANSPIGVISSVVELNGSTDYIEIYAIVPSAITTTSGTIYSDFSGFLARKS